MYNVYIIISIVADLLITLENNLLESVYDLWRPLLMYPLLFTCCIAFHTVAIAVVSLFISKNKKYETFNNIYRRISIETIDVILKIMKIRLHVSGSEKIPENKRFLFICNHISVFDPMIAMHTFNSKELAFVSKKELIDMPFGGRLMHASGCIPLDRENNRSAVKTIKEVASRISWDYSSMGIYPEGGINKTDKLLMPFHSGSFKIAKKAGAPIVVSTIRNTENLFKRFIFSYTDVYLDIIGVIQPEEHKELSTNEISSLAWNEMYEHLSHTCSSSPDTETENNKAAC